MTAMILDLLHGAQRLDATLARKLGPTYNAVLGIGLIAEIVRRLREFGELPTGGAVRTALTVALFGLLLLHQIAELGEHVDRRRERRKTR
jgi:hypothetical protein